MIRNWKREEYEGKSFRGKGNKFNGYSIAIDFHVNFHTAKGQGTSQNKVKINQYIIHHSFHLILFPSLLTLIETALSLGIEPQSIIMH